jgi:hypothetical protein
MQNQRRLRRHARPKISFRHYELLEDRLLLTGVSGDIPNGTVWNSSQVEEISGRVDVPAGSTLTIMPGTVVKFDGGASMTVDGTLKAQPNPIHQNQHERRAR